MSFHLLGRLHQIAAVPFGWKPSPYVFSEIMRVLVRVLRSPGLPSEGDGGRGQARPQVYGGDAAYKIDTSRWCAAGRVRDGQASALGSWAGHTPLRGRLLGVPSWKAWPEPPIVTKASAAGRSGHVQLGTGTKPSQGPLGAHENGRPPGADCINDQQRRRVLGTGSQGTAHILKDSSPRTASATVSVTEGSALPSG